MEQATHSIPPGGAKRIGELWVLAKPAGLATHPAPGLDDDLLSWSHREHQTPADLAPINRLDRATSGLVLTSRCPKERARFGEFFAQHQVEKTYLALVHGQTPENDTIERALLDRRRGKKLSATTHLERKRLLPGLSYLEVRPVTGRRHQIRRHLRGKHHPIVGDTRYGKRALPEGAPDRLWLHCSQLVLPAGLALHTPLPPELEEHLRSFDPP